MPDAPINLTRDEDVTDADVIRFTWTEGLSDGGTPVIDYDVYWDQSTGNWELLLADVPVTNYQTDFPITTNVVYSFKLTARNTVGVGLESEPIAIRAAERPDAPLYLSNVESITNSVQVGLVWIEGHYDGGSPVIDYRVSYK